MESGTFIGLALIIMGCLALGGMAQVSLTMPTTARPQRRTRAALAVTAGIVAAGLVPLGLVVIRDPGTPPNYIVLVLVGAASLGMTAFCVSMFWGAGRRADQAGAAKDS